MNEHDIIAGLIALTGAVAGYYFRSMNKSIRALECALRECLDKLDSPAPPER